MRYHIFLLPLILIMHGVSGQSRINRFSINTLPTLYTYGEGNGYLNNVVRLTDGVGFTFKTFDTIKKQGMAYELNAININAYYDDVSVPNGIMIST